jgi:alanine dehydrogenase
MAVGLGAAVTVLDRSLPRLRELDDIFNGRIRTRYSTIEALEEEAFSADMVIGAVLIPGAVPITSAHALNNATLMYGLKLANQGLKAIAEDRHLRAGLNVHAGRITNGAVAEALGYDMVEPQAALKVA